MDEQRAQVALLIDVESVVPASPPDPEAVGALAAALHRYASGAGRVALARAYADWAPAAARASQGARVVPVLVPPAPAGTRRSAVRLATEALEALYVGGEPDAFVIATGDPALLPLVQAIRADGAEVVLVHPSTAPFDDVRAEADRVATVEDVLAGAVAEPATLRPVREEGWDEAEEAPPPRREPDRGYAPRRPAYPPRDRDYDRPPRPPAGPIDFSTYDWAPFVRLIDELERRLPFVGVRYLVNKVLGPRNCGVDDPRQKRDLINRAVDEGILEMYTVGNLDERADPVTACRLDRKNPTVAGVLGADSAPPPVAREGDREGDREGLAGARARAGDDDGDDE
jgi:hypothetical protein